MKEAAQSQNRTRYRTWEGAGGGACGSVVTKNLAESKAPEGRNNLASGVSHWSERNKPKKPRRGGIQPSRYNQIRNWGLTADTRSAVTRVSILPYIAPLGLRITEHTTPVADAIG